MINSKETLKKLHKKFPLLTLDELFDILDCYTEEFTNGLWRLNDTYSDPYRYSITSNAKPLRTYGEITTATNTSDCQLTAGH